MTGLVWRAKRLGVGCSSAELAAYLGYLHGLDVSPSDVRAWESDDVDPPEVLGEVLAELAERRDTQARSWVVAHETIRIPADRQHLPTVVGCCCSGSGGVRRRRRRRNPCPRNHEGQGTPVASAGCHGYRTGSAVPGRRYVLAGDCCGVRRQRAHCS